MSRTVDAQVQRAIETAERAGRLVTADTPRGATALRTRHKAGRLASPAPGAFARPEYWQQLSRDEQDLHLIKTESHRHRDWIFAGASAGLLHGLEIPFALRGRICVATSVRSHSSSSTRTQRIRVDEDETVVVSGVPATSLVRTVFDCTRGSSLRLGLPVADSALRALSKDPLANGTNTELRELMEQVDLRFSGHRGIENTRRTLALADGRAESGGEPFSGQPSTSWASRLPSCRSRSRTRSFRAGCSALTWDTCARMAAGCSSSLTGLASAARAVTRASFRATGRESASRTSASMAGRSCAWAGRSLPTTTFSQCFAIATGFRAAEFDGWLGARPNLA